MFVANALGGAGVFGFYASFIEKIRLSRRRLQNLARDDFASIKGPSGSSLPRWIGIQLSNMTAISIENQSLNPLAVIYSGSANDFASVFDAPVAVETR